MEQTKLADFVASQHGDCECVADEAECAETDDKVDVDEDSSSCVDIAQRRAADCVSLISGA